MKQRIRAHGTLGLSRTDALRRQVENLIANVVALAVHGRTPKAPCLGMVTIWSRRAWPILSGRTRQVALPVVLMVGTILLAVNQRAEPAAGDADNATLMRALAKSAIPYIMSSVGYLNGR